MPTWSRGACQERERGTGQRGGLPLVTMFVQYSSFLHAVVVLFFNRQFHQWLSTTQLLTNSNVAVISSVILHRTQLINRAAMLSTGQR